ITHVDCPIVHRESEAYTVLYLLYLRYPDLHSFPTRRSSDLIGRGLWFLRRDATVEQAACQPFADRKSLFPNDVRAHAPSKRTERSEEHTSELQSRENLVCRLLLEKKKT